MSPENSSLVVGRPQGIQGSVRERSLLRRGQSTQDPGYEKGASKKNSFVLVDWKKT